MTSNRSFQVIDDFLGPDLDRDLWVDAYLPAWSSRDLARAAWNIASSSITLSIPHDHPVWCEGDHHPPLRVSAIQSGSWSGPVGSTRSQQPYREGLTVREAQPDFEGWTPMRGRIEVRARADISHRSMFSFWLIGREVDPHECAEICIVEVFGNTRRDGSLNAGAGVHAFRDPGATEDFGTVSLPIDVAQWRVSSVDWTVDTATFAIDGEVFRFVSHPPRYPMQLEAAVFDFPDWSNGNDADLVPQLMVDWIRYTPAAD